MPPQDPNQTSQPTTHNPLAAMRPGEQVIFELKRHPIGILAMYVMTGIVLVVLAVMAFGVAPGLFASSARNQVMVVSGLAYLIFALVCLVFNLIATTVYWGNKWIMTDDSITQVTQTSLFKKESSQLALESLEDVTAEQNGILTQMFNYGVLKAETAGHRSKFVFNYCPNPNYYAQKVLQTREQLEHFNSQDATQSEAATASPAEQPQSPNYPSPQV